MKKRFAVLLLIFCVIAGLCGCGGDKPKTAEAPNPSVTEAAKIETENTAEPTEKTEPTESEAPAEGKAALKEVLGGEKPTEKPSLPIAEKPTNDPAVEADNKVTDNPAETEKTSENICTLTVSCEELLGNEEFLDEAKRSLVPESGIIFSKSDIEFTEGESAFDILQRSLKDEKIHMEYNSTPAYNSVYIEGINNIYEMDAGATSGWTYTVNGEYPASGCNNYTVKNGDNILFYYILSY